MNIVDGGISEGCTEHGNVRGIFRGVVDNIYTISTEVNLHKLGSCGLIPIPVKHRSSAECQSIPQFSVHVLYMHKYTCYVVGNGTSSNVKRIFPHVVVPECVSTYEVFTASGWGWFGSSHGR